MNKNIDERILNYINSEEKIEKQKDICNGQVKIIDKYYEFSERVFYDGDFKMYIPKSFEEMNETIKKLKYPSENRPEIILSDETCSIVVSLNLIDSVCNDDYVYHIRDFMKNISKRLNESNLFFDEGLLTIDEKKIAFYDYKSSAIDDYIYNLVFLLELEGKTLMGTFSCPYSIHDEWKNIALEMVKTIKVMKKDPSHNDSFSKQENHKTTFENNSRKIYGRVNHL